MNYSGKRALVRPVFLPVLAVVLLALLAGCSDRGTTVQTVIPITMPAEPDVATPQPAPKIGHLLGRGSMAIVREGRLEVVGPTGGVLARGPLAREVQEWFEGQAVKPWSKDGTRLVYQSARNVLRVMDFELGEDRLLIVAPENMAINGPYMWIDKGTDLVFHMHPSPQGRVSLWKVGSDGTQLARIDPVLSEFAEEKVGTIIASDVSSDGSKLLITGDREPKGDSAVYLPAVYLLDVHSNQATRITPADKVCLGGRFMPNNSEALVLCKEILVPTNSVRTDVYATSVIGDNFRKLAQGDESGLYVAGVSSDGSKIALVRGRSWSPAGTGPEDTVLLLNLSNGEMTTIIQAPQGLRIEPLGFMDNNRFLVWQFPEMGIKPPVLPNVSSRMPGTIEQIDLTSGIKKTLQKNVSSVHLVPDFPAGALPAN